MGMRIQIAVESEGGNHRVFIPIIVLKELLEAQGVKVEEEWKVAIRKIEAVVMEGLRK